MTKLLIRKSGKRRLIKCECAARFDAGKYDKCPFCWRDAPMEKSDEKRS